jgi:hypothetical protein
MLGSNPSADSVASTDQGDVPASPFHFPVETLIGRGSKALNPGGSGAKPPGHCLLLLRMQGAL